MTRSRFFKPRVEPALVSRIVAWRRRSAADLAADAAKMRWVVVDVESSGQNPYSDHLLSIGAVAIQDGRIRFDDGFETVLQQSHASDTANILLHGIGGQRQVAGEPPDLALTRFLEYCGKDPVVAFHAAFDKALIGRALDTVLGIDLASRWLDLVYLAPGLLPEIKERCHTLDDWAAQFGIINHARHNAVADALATAELFLALYPEGAASRHEPGQ
ncbi:MAG: DNA polymerase III subunit epsilon [Deltaproteobacteria bacterium CG23_combo_of_CG06-09_8_20_14_all_60_8]|nr:MAG: DNA polymerase III subunit epsilon [Deltaproteobacteria bacterium CG23_combo_of_CG06-09_8_20_14_all_60_8]